MGFRLSRLRLEEGEELVSYTERTLYSGLYAEDVDPETYNGTCVYKEDGERKIVNNPFVSPLTDIQAVELLARTRYPESTAKEMVQAWRAFVTRDGGRSYPAAWHVKEGFTLLTHAPNAGPCQEKFQRLPFEIEDLPSVESCVFWYPSVIEKTLNLKPEEQMRVLADTRVQSGLPDHHLTDVGSPNLLANLLLGFLQATGRCAPLGWNYARTNAQDHERYVIIHWYNCSCLEMILFDHQWFGNLGVFPLGIERL